MAKLSQSSATPGFSLDFFISYISHYIINFLGKEILKDGTGSLSRSGSVDFTG